MTPVLQLVRLPLPAGYTAPADLPITPAFDETAWSRSDPGSVVALVTHSMVGVPEALWDRFPGLKLVANFGVGLDRIDLDAARARGIHVTYTPDHLTADVADLAITFALALLRRIPEAHAYVRDGEWSSGPFRLGTSAAGRRLGIIGLGRIGQAVAHRAAAFGMEIGYTARGPKSVPHHHFTSPVEMAEWADILVATIPGGAETDRMISAEMLRALGSGGILVNVARASVVDETALIEALHSGTIAGAGMELFDAGSTLPAALAGLGNVLLTPHIGSATFQTRSAMADSVFANVRAALDGGTFSDLAV